MSAINLDESDLPDQVTEEEEKEEEKPTRRKTLAVPIFSVGVMGELNKKLGARAGRKSSVERKRNVFELRNVRQRSGVSLAKSVKKSFLHS